MRNRGLYPMLALLPMTWLTASAADPSELSPAEKTAVEALSCPALTGGRFASMHQRIDQRLGIWEVDVECEPTKVIRGHAVRDVAHCSGVDAAWTCESAGQEVELSAGGWDRSVLVLHTSAETGLDIFEFLQEQARRGKQIKADTLEGYPTIAWIEGNDHYWITFQFSDFTYSYHVTEKCKQQACRRKLQYDGAYQSWNLE